MGRQKSRLRWLALLAAAIAGLLVAGVAASFTLVRPQQPPGQWSASNAATPPPLPDPPPVLGAFDGQPPAPTADGVRAAIDSLVRDSNLGSRISVEVVDVVSGARLYRHRADAPTVPASTIKLVTGAAVLATRGPAYQIPTTVVAGAEPGEVVLVGGGDPTLAIDDVGSYPGAARLDRLAAQVLDALGDTPVTKVRVDATLFTGPVLGPWTPDIPDSGYVGPITALMTDGGRVDPTQVEPPAPRWNEPDRAAGEAFAKLLGLKPDAVARGEAPPPASEVSGDDPDATHAPGTELGRVESPPMLRLVEIMLIESDNVVAEALARQVALAQEQPASFAGAAAATTAVLKDLGAPLGESVFTDGSGLSRTNQLSAHLLTSLLTTAADPDVQPALAGLFTGLPVAGWSGTLATRYQSSQSGTTPGAGVVRVKTGTLTGVHSIAGVIVTADGRLLAMALLTDSVPLDQNEARQALDRVATALAACGCG